jgi:hypothetical protein|tara:strand:- start:278 stop:454 length:177 start_codon:yes stop_codon:yes gene_type:complete
MKSNKQSAELARLVNRAVVSIDIGGTAMKGLKGLISEAKTKVSSLVNSNLEWRHVSGR